MGKSRYVCQECGAQSIQWLGKCPACAAWNTMVEEADGSAAPAGKKGGKELGLLDSLAKGKSKKVAPLSDLKAAEASRSSTGIQEFDRVLGGGAVEGSFLLVGGDPGIGKSTLILQALDQLSKTKKVLYVTGEESTDQVKLRAERLGVKGSKLLLAAETSLEKILEIVEEERPDVLAVDSIQTVYSSSLDSAPGSVSQVRDVGAKFMHLAKGAGIFVILVGHVTKDGTIAGPRVLEHMVDTVLYFEAMAGQNYRVLRAVKNRFGSTNEIGVFEMTDAGLQEVRNPSGVFLAERPKLAPGSVVVSTMEGTRPVLVELQALVTKSFLANPRRTFLGVDSNRASILLAVLEKKVELALYERDVFLNVVGGLRLQEPSADLGLVVAVASSFYNRPVGNDQLFIGEVGLTGEVRSVSRLEDRLKEAATMGFKECFVPARNHQTLKGGPKGIEVIPVRQAQEVIQRLFN